MTTQLLERQSDGGAFTRSMQQGEQLGLYTALERLGPATIYGVAREAMVDVPFAFVWLETQRRGGFVHRDESTGCYGLACYLPQRA